MKNIIKNRRIAVCLPSYKRLESLERQIFSFMHQTYDPECYHLFVAVKGITEFTFKKVLLPRFQEFVNAGRLTLRYFPNKNQMSNIIDSVRDLDVSGYELFVKIDDDDFYSRDYLENINKFHTTVPGHYSSYYSARDLVTRNPEGFFCLRKEFYSFFGFALNMSPEVFGKVLECERDPSVMIALVEKWQKKAGHTNFGFTEDNFIHRLMKECGCSNMDTFVRENGILPHIIVQKGNASVTRGGMVDKRFRSANSKISTNPETWEHVLELEHPDWRDVFRLQGNRGQRLACGDWATIVEMTPESLVIAWDKWGRESFIANEDFLYVFSGKNESAKAD